MTPDRSFVDLNICGSTNRMRDLAAGLTDEALQHPVGERATGRRYLNRSGYTTLSAPALPILSLHVTISANPPRQRSEIMADFHIELAGPNAAADAEALRRTLAGAARTQITPRPSCVALTPWSSSPSARPCCNRPTSSTASTRSGGAASAPARLPPPDDHHPPRRHAHRAGRDRRGDAQDAVGVTTASRECA